MHAELLRLRQKPSPAHRSFIKPKSVPSYAPPSPITQLQRKLGNQAIQRLVQAKLKISQPGDLYEEEADRIAEQVVQRKAESCHCGVTCSKCQAETKGLIQRKPELHSNTSGAPVPGSFLHQIGSGQPLPHSARAFLEPRFGQDFGSVRVHTDAQSAESARAINARAFTVGRDVVFGVGQYATGTTAGRLLLAHELAHVVRQGPSEPTIQRQDADNNNQPQTIDFTLNVTPQISWAITALLIRPVAEEDTWACLAGVPEYDKPRVLLNYLIQYRGNSAFAQIDAQRPPDLDRDAYLIGVAEYIWSLIRDQFMAMAVQRMNRNAAFRAKVDEAARGYGCSRVPFIEQGGDIAV